MANLVTALADRLRRSRTAQSPHPPPDPTPETSAPFIPPMDDWVRSHYLGVPEQTLAILGSLAGKRVLDVGCGDGLIGLGLVNAGASEVVGLDIKPLPPDLVDSTVDRIAAGGFRGAREARHRFTATRYDGVAMPVDTESVDVAFSWGVFEHVPDVKSVLLEMRRVMKPDAIGFIKVHPWFHTVYGSHLSDFTPAFAHLTSSPEALHATVLAHLDAKPTPLRGLVLDHMWPEYLTLNRYSANAFYEDFSACGFSSHRWKLIPYEMDLACAPPGVSLSDLLVCGTEVVFRK